MLAIVIPYYKLSFFEETLQSLANQTDKRFKVYIGDDASPENPSELIAKYIDQLDLVYHRFETNLGGTSLVKQWDRCIALSAKEEWLMLLGDDDYLGLNCIEEFYNSKEDVIQLNINVIRFVTRVIEVNGKLTTLYKHPQIESATDSFYRKFFKKSRGSLSEQIFRKESYLKYGFRDFPLAWGSDDFAWLDFTSFGNIYTINEAIVYFRISTENISRKGYKDEIKNEARYIYFSLIVRAFLTKFEKGQRFKLLSYYEQLVYDLNKTSIYFWLLMCKLFVQELRLIQVVKFSRRILIYQLKKWNL